LNAEGRQKLSSQEKAVWRASHSCLPCSLFSKCTAKAPANGRRTAKLGIRHFSQPATPAWALMCDCRDPVLDQFGNRRERPRPLGSGRREHQAVDDDPGRRHGGGARHAGSDRRGKALRGRGRPITGRSPSRVAAMPAVCWSRRPGRRPGRLVHSGPSSSGSGLGVASTWRPSRQPASWPSSSRTGRGAMPASSPAGTREGRRRHARAPQARCDDRGCAAGLTPQALLFATRSPVRNSSIAQISTITSCRSHQLSTDG
jgi:hypothetical protein